MKPKAKPKNRYRPKPPEFNPHAEFFRPPPSKAHCPWTGLSRTTLLNASKACGALVSLRQKGKQRGSLLVHRETLMKHLRSLIPKR